MTVFLPAVAASAQQAGGIRGTVYDRDFDVPLAAAQVSIVETDEQVITSDEGNFVFGEVEPGTYTLVFSKEGYTRQVKGDVVVSPGRVTEVDASLSGEFVEMEEFIVEDLELGAASEIQLLKLRLERPELMDSISAELMSQAGASDVAGALTLVSGATVQEGKYAVVRGLPDRYVSSQMNSVRLPTADPDKRAVQLDQFPAAVIDSVQVSKTFTPEQQGDASGGAVNMMLKRIPEEEETGISSSGQISYNSQVRGRNDFLSYRGGGVNFWGIDDGDRDIQYGNIGDNWTGAVGVSPEDAPLDYKWSVSGGGTRELETGMQVGGFANFFYERDSAFYDDGIDDKYWVEDPGDPMTPQFGSNQRPSQGNFRTSLFDVTQGTEEVQWGTLGTVGLETDNHSLSVLYMYTRVAEDVATLAEDTRGKKSLHRFWPQFYGPEFDDYDMEDPNHPANQERDAAPFIRTQTLEYTERTTNTVQFSGRHTLPDPNVAREGLFGLLNPELDWTAAFSSAGLYQPDKRQFGAEWRAASNHPVFPNIQYPQTYSPFKPAVNANLGFLQRVWKDISEDSEQYLVNLKLPFEQWSEDEGYLKFGFFYDDVEREFDQDSFANFGDNSSLPDTGWNDFWSDAFPSENHPIFPADTDVDYDGEQNISAWYYMADLPLSSSFKVIGGCRFETTELAIMNTPEQNAFWNPPGQGSTQVTPGLYPDGADVEFEQDDELPSIGFEFTPWEPIKLRGSYTETVARQTFKELTPIQQMEFLGGDVFVGFPGLKMSALKNYDLRADYTPYEGALVSLSYFYKDIKDPIEYVQAYGDFVYTTPRNYPDGELSGFEFEVRQRLARFWENMEGLTLGANATLIDSEVTLPAEEVALFSQPNIMAPMSSRDMTNAPEHLYNLYLTYDWQRYGTRFGVFYTVRGDTLVAGAGQSQGRFIPNVYETEFGTLNLSLSQKIKEKWNLKLQLKNLLNPKIESVYRSKYIGGDVTKTSYRKGWEFSISLSAEF